MPKHGISLDNKVWKWRVGDNPDFAKSELDDSNWESIEPSKDVMDLPQVPKTGEIGWFRLHLYFGSQVDKIPLAVRVGQSGASEIYLNNQLLKRIGTLSSNPKNIIATDPGFEPIFLARDSGREQVLAVRFALQPSVGYTNAWEGGRFAMIKMWINSLDISEKEYTEQKM